MTAEMSPRRYRTAGEVLNGIREQLKVSSQDDMKVLLKIFKELADLDWNNLSPSDAADWLMREETKREQSIRGSANQAGFNQGMRIGLFVGFGLCTFLATAIIMGR